MSEAKTYTLDVPGAVLSYDVRENEASDEPVLLIIGSPMGASVFATLAGHFGDRTVVTYDPRGADRSRRTDSTAEMTPDQHADDLHRLIRALGAGRETGCRWGPSIRSRSARWWRTSRRPRRSCRTTWRSWTPAGTSGRPT